MSRVTQLLSITTVGALAALGCGGPSQPKFAITHVEKRAKLDNGLRMVIMPDSTTPLVQVDVRYEVGSKEDPPGKAGLAHLVEHMMFQHRFGAPDTPVEQRPPTFQVLPQIALDFNAFTNWDTTHYYLVAPKEDVELLLRLEAARMATGCDTIPKEQFEREREVVRNEIRQRTGTAEGQIYQAVLDAVYPKGHAYSQMIGGNDAQLASITFDDVCKFMKAYYVPGRATVIVTGNVDPQETGKLVKFNFGAIPRGTPGPLKKVDAIAVKHQTKEIQLDIERTTIQVMFPLPPQNSDEYSAVQQMLFVLTAVLANFAEEWEFGDVSPGLLGGAYAPILAISIELKPGKTPEEALDYVWKALNVARRNTGIMLEGGSWESEEIAKVHYRQSVVESLEPLASRSIQIAEMIQFDRRVDFDSNQVFIYELLDRIDSLDPSKYKSVVRKTLDKDKAIVLIARASAKGIKGDRRAKLKFSAKTHDEMPPPPIDVTEAKRPLKAPQSDSILVKAERFELPNGMKVVLLPYSGLPIVHANLLFDVGAVHEPVDKAGLADVAASFLSLPPGADAYGKTGIRIGGTAGMDSTVFTGRGINIYLEIILKGLERIVTVGDINQRAIERHQTRFKEVFKRESYQRDYTYGLELESALYGAEHPYVTKGSPTPKTLGRIGRDAAMEFVRKHYTAKNATLIVAGNFDPAQARSHIKEIFGPWNGGRKDEPVTTKAAERTGPEYVGVIGKDESPQMTVTIAFPGPAGIDGQQAARLVLQSMLNLRMATIRTQLGSTYGTYAGRSTRRGPTAYQLGGAVDVERAGESLRFMRAQIDELRAGKDFDRDFVSARRIVLKQLMATSTESYTLASRLLNIASFGLEPDYQDKLARYVAAVSPAQVKALIEQELDPNREVVVCMAGRSRLEKAFVEAGLDKVRYVEPARK